MKKEIKLEKIKGNLKVNKNIIYTILYIIIGGNILALIGYDLKQIATTFIAISIYLIGMDILEYLEEKDGKKQREK